MGFVTFFVGSGGVGGGGAAAAAATSCGILLLLVLLAGGTKYSHSRVVSFPAGGPLRQARAVCSTTRAIENPAV